MRPSLPQRAPDEHGFILVGVIMFMLALTILGLSLFALSSYEAQFFVASAAREQALQNSESGMELVKALLSGPNAKLEDAHRAEGQLGITSALAYQWRNGDSTSRGPLDLDTLVVIVVAAKSGGIERTLQAKFVPGTKVNPYQGLMAAGAGVTVDPENSSTPGSGDPRVLQIAGRVWQPVQSAADTAWADQVTRMPGTLIERGTPPMPLADAFVDGDTALAAPPSSGLDLTYDYTYDNYQLTLLGSPSSAKIFRSPNSPTASSTYSFYVNDDLDISVKDNAVWVIPQGAFFRHRVRVERANRDVPGTLVIVAKANQRDPGHENIGIWFRGGLDVADGLQVYLVSQGDVVIQHHADEDKSNTAGALSIVAGGRITIGGPDSDHHFDLGYQASTMDVLSQRLLAWGALPQVTGGTGVNFVALRQSWAELTPR